MIAGQAHRSRPFRFGLTPHSPATGLANNHFARAVESAGFDVLTFADHLMPAIPPFSGPTAAAMVTDGRVELGLGAGDLKSEYDAAGIPFDRRDVRVTRLEEAASIIRALLDGGAVDVAGAHYRVHAEAQSLLPTPAHRVPLLIGGNGERVLRLAGRVADIAGFAGITHNHDATEVALTHFGPDGLDDRIALVRDAAGDRFDRIALNALIQAVVVTDDRERPPRRNSPTPWVGSTPPRCWSPRSS
jgi:alkanesulfonate monooxygenase SsuD/methylene tetrahydromethanopterin reductase-like flavin-dependent oxidoreductase (luciferase family)